MLKKIEKIELNEKGNLGVAVTMFGQIISTNSYEVLLAKKLNELIDNQSAIVDYLNKQNEKG